MITKSAPSRNTGKQGGGVREEEEEGQLQQQAPPAVGATVASINRVGTAKRPLPLTRRSNSAPKTLLPSTPSSVQPRSAPAEEQPNPIAVESVLADLQKLHSPKQSLHFPVASPPVSPTRRVHFAQDLTGGGVGLKEVVSVLVLVMPGVWSTPHITIAFAVCCVFCPDLSWHW